MNDDASSGWLNEPAGRERPYVVFDDEGKLRHVGLVAFERFGRAPTSAEDLAELLLAEDEVDGGAELADLLHAILTNEGRTSAKNAGRLRVRSRGLANGLRLVDWAADGADAGAELSDGELLNEILAQVDHGIVLYDRDREGRDVVRLYNKLAEELMEVPEGFMRRGLLRDDIVNYCVKRGDYGAAFDGRNYLKEVRTGQERRTTGRRPSGRYVESLSRQREDGRGSLALNFDVTADIAQRNLLRDAEEHYRLLAECAPTGILTLDASGKVAFANEAAIALLGRATDAIELVEQLVPVDGRPLARHLETSATFDAEIRRNGGLLHVMVSVAPSQRHRGARIITLADFTALRQAKQQIEHLARHDPLTGLGNRSLFSVRWSAIEARDTKARPAHLIALDLDRFKLVNDEHGHETGDLLLTAVAARLRETVEPAGEVFRLGGDEFAVIVADAPRETALDLARSLVERLAAPFHLGDVAALIGCSAGVASMPQDGATGGDVQRAADLALYNVKRNGRNGFASFDPALAREMGEQRRLASDLALALAGDAFSLMYQPVFELKSGRIVRVEALLRWNNRRLGTHVCSAALIRLAEEAGLVTLVDLWVMRTAVAELRAFLDAGVERPAMSINMSKVTLSRPEIVDRVLDALRENGVEGRFLEIEVNQGSGRQNLDALRSTLVELRRAGITVALDDFGAGDTALSTLRSLPFDRVKLDRSITEGMGRDVDAEAIASAILSICRRLDRRMTAEGIETEAQRAALDGLGDIDGQGFLLAPPESGEATLVRLLAQQREPRTGRRPARARAPADTARDA